VAEKQLELNLGKACNNACVFCSNGNVNRADRRLLELDLVRHELDQAAQAGYTALGLLGGEPTLHPDLDAIVRHARDRGFTRVALCTNGRRLRDPARLAALVAAGVTRITLSIHSHDPAVADALCGREGAFAQQIQALENIVSGLAAGTLDLPEGFAANSCIHGRNVRTLVPLARFLRRLGVRDIRFNYLRPENQAATDPTLLPRFPAVTRALEALVVWNETRGRLQLSFSDLPLCVFPAPFFVNRALFRRYLGDLRDLDTDVLVFRGLAQWRDQFQWKQRRTHRLKQKAPVCAGCRVEPACEGIWRRYRDLYGDAGIEPVR